MRWIIPISIVILNLIDGILTKVFIEIGFAEEKNFIINYLFPQIGHNLIIFKFILSSFVTIIFFYYWRKYKIAKYGAILVAFCYEVIIIYTIAGASYYYIIT